MKAVSMTAHTLFGLALAGFFGVSTVSTRPAVTTATAAASRMGTLQASATLAVRASGDMHTTLPLVKTDRPATSTASEAALSTTSANSRRAAGAPRKGFANSGAPRIGALTSGTATAIIPKQTTSAISLKFPVNYTSLPVPPGFSQAPELAELVKDGKLPPVRQRLPRNPVVVEPVDQVGRYGGSMRKLASNVGDLQMNHRLGYEPLIRWGRDGQSLEPNIAESWEMRDGGRTFVFHLRKGMKWSDGAPFTSADFKFTYDYILNYDGFGLLALPWLRADNKLPTIETPDPYTVIYRFEVPYGNFVRGVAASGLQQFLFGPKHYLQQFHEAFVPDDELQAMISDAGFVTWMDFFLQRMDLSRNPDLPTMSPYQLAIGPPASQCVAERNPYYWKVDPEGKQLPYIDRIVTNMVFDRTILNLKALNGEVDFQIRNIDAGNFTLFKERGRQVGYDTLVTPSTNPICVYVNQFSRNEQLRPILQDSRFRKALSHAINREELVELIYSGLAKPSSAISMPMDEFYIPGIDQANTEYDPELANRLLDEMGLKRRRGDGLRTFPDGTLFSVVLHIYPSEEGTNADLWQLVVDYWREVGLMFAPKQEDQTLSFLQVTSGNSDFFCYSNAALHWAVDGLWKVPISNMSYMAPLYGAYYSTDGEEGVKPSAEMQRMVDWYEALRATPDEAERLQLGQNILKQWAKECYVIGICQSPVVSIVSERLKNVPDVINYDYRLKSPGYLNIEQFYIDEHDEDEVAGK